MASVHRGHGSRRAVRYEESRCSTGAGHWHDESALRTSASCPARASRPTPPPGPGRSMIPRSPTAQLVRGLSRENAVWTLAYSYVLHELGEFRKLVVRRAHLGIGSVERN